MPHSIPYGDTTLAVARIPSGGIWRNSLVPAPHVESLEALNDALAARCRRRLDDRPRRHTETIGARLGRDREALLECEVTWFFARVRDLWRRALQRRSQRTYMNWEKFGRLVDRIFPPISIQNLMPCHRFDARTRGRSPVR